MSRARSCFVTLLFVAYACVFLTAQTPPKTTEHLPDDAAQTEATPSKQNTDPFARPLTRKQQKANRKKLKTELRSVNSLDQQIPYIVTDEEKAAFSQLSNDEERDAFIETIWQRRDPTPDTVENEFKDEYYRRIAYANEHFGAGMPGWKTDRGRIYILHGPPDEIESHPSGGTYDRTPQEGGGSTSTFPFERWRYRYVEEVGQEVVVEFVDTCMCGDYHMTMDPNEKDALAHTPMGQPRNNLFANSNSNQFENLRQFVGMNQPPKVRFQDLRDIVISKVTFNAVHFDVLASFIKAAGDTALVPVTIQIKDRDITFVNHEGVERGTVNIFGSVTTLSGKVAQTFEDTVQVDVPAALQEKGERSSVYWKALPMRSGHYLMEIVVKDVNGDRVGTWRHSLAVPEFRDDRLLASSLIVADRMEPVATTNIGKGSFVLGETFVRPRVPSDDGKPASFKRDQKIAFWMQVYNLGTDGKTHRPNATVDYDVINEVTNKSVLHTSQSTSQLASAGDQITLQKTLAAGDLPPGAYQLHVRVNDELSKQNVETSARFAVE